MLSNHESLSRSSKPGRRLSGRGNVFSKHSLLARCQGLPCFPCGLIHSQKFRQLLRHVCGGEAKRERDDRTCVNAKYAAIVLGDRYKPSLIIPTADRAPRYGNAVYGNIDGGGRLKIPRRDERGGDDDVSRKIRLLSFHRDTNPYVCRHRHCSPPSTEKGAERQASAGARDGVKGKGRTLAARAPLHALVSPRRKCERLIASAASAEAMSIFRKGFNDRDASTRI